VALLVIDASVVIAHLQEDDPHHDAAVAALALRGAAELVFPASAYAEVLVGAFRSGKVAVSYVERFVAESPVRIEPITAEIARRAASLRARHAGAALADALVLATAEVLEAERVLTADKSWAKWSRRVRVI
jgi:predicted nucleic acid-binding protein